MHPFTTQHRTNTPRQGALQDDPKKYPNKESAGLLTGATGGFAGGELGVKQFVDKASLDIAPPEVARKRLLPKDIAAVSALIAIVAASNYGFQRLQAGEDAAPLPTLEDLAAAPAAVSSGAQGLAQGTANAAAAVAGDPRLLYTAAAVSAVVLAVVGGRAVKAGVDRAAAKAAQGAGRRVVQGSVILVFAALAVKLAQDW